MDIFLGTGGDDKAEFYITIYNNATEAASLPTQMMPS